LFVVAVFAPSTVVAVTVAKIVYVPALAYVCVFTGADGGNVICGTLPSPQSHVTLVIALDGRAVPLYATDTLQGTAPWVVGTVQPSVMIKPDVALGPEPGAAAATVTDVEADAVRPFVSVTVTLTV
jgi:hypothetical protein